MKHSHYIGDQTLTGDLAFLYVNELDGKLYSAKDLCTILNDKCHTNVHQTNLKLHLMQGFILL
jgi:hypothetical protein